MFYHSKVGIRILYPIKGREMDEEFQRRSRGKCGRQIEISQCLEVILWTCNIFGARYQQWSTERYIDDFDICTD